ncbi:hypothetical protein GGQ72_002220 [Rhizobium rhizoryzae]|uniref:Uncharacterized protein n=1 Tax=Rhizobium rhizoryzae TaxID=451876 RepID=A0A7W6LGC8_9HYPH|nr:hypothetical protein [Rhizobium rhizoryzae]
MTYYPIRSTGDALRVPATFCMPSFANSQEVQP